MSKSKENMHAGAAASKFEFAAALRKRETQAEKKVWEYLKTKPFGVKFRRQHPFADYVLDFYCHKLKLCIELDGEIHHNQKEYDSDRTDIINSYGIKEVRFTNNFILRQFEEFKIFIEEEIKSYP